MKKTKLTENQKKNELLKRGFMLLLVMFLCSASAFAQSGGSGTDSQIDGVNTIKSVFATVYAFFTSAAIRVIAIAGVIVTGMKIITNKGNPDAAKPLVWIFIACIIIGSASWFVAKFMGTSIKDTSTLGGTSWY